MGGTDDRLAASLDESFDHPIEILSRDARHVGKRDQSTGDGWWQRANAELQRARQAVGEIRITDLFHVEAGERARHFLGLMAQHRNGSGYLARQDESGGPADQFLAIKVRQKLVA